MALRQTGNDPDDLAARLRQGDEDALEELLRSLGPAVHRVLARKFVPVLREVEIDDVLSIALYRVWRARQRYDADKGSLRLWFFRIAENAARDVLRHGWHKARRLEVSATGIETKTRSSADSNGRPGGPHERDDLPDSETSVQRKSALRDILAGLPEAQRRIVLADALCREGVASSQRMASELNLSPASIRVYRKRAMETIRAELEQRGLAPVEEKTVRSV
jgi:RNA polymerase sigma-70 factor (ECF subfamily)